MVAEVAKTLAGDYGSRILAIEGPTGTGKSLAYLLGALPVAIDRQRSLIVSTATVALQEQLVKKDLPDLLANSGLKFTFRLAKGRRRYVCDPNLVQLAQDDAGQCDLVDADTPEAWSPGRQGLWRVRPEPGERQAVRRMAHAREQHQWSGDLDEWDEQPREALREMLTTNGTACTYRRCHFYAQCPFFLARADRDSADVIVANHTLVVADLMMGGGIVLPDPEDCIYVFDTDPHVDKGHHLYQVALDQGATATHLLGARQWLDNVARGERDLFKLLPKHSYQDGLQALQESNHKDIPQLMDRLRDLHRLVDSLYPASETRGRAKSGAADNEADVWRFPMGRIDSPELIEAFNNAAKVTGLVRKLVEKMVSLVDKALKDDAIQEVQASPVLSGLLWTLARVNSTEIALTRLGEVDDPDSAQPPRARWITCITDGQDYEVAVSPTSVAARLPEMLWSRCDGAVLTSATLTSLGTFHRLCEQTGLSPDTIQTCKLDSLFDYRGRARLVIPSMETLPNEREAHSDEIARLMYSGLIDPNEGTLVLFSSYWQMRAVQKRLEGSMAKRVLMQGEAARAQLLRTHKARIEAGQGSILFCARILFRRAGSAGCIL